MSLFTALQRVQRAAGLQIHSCPSTTTGWPARLAVALVTRMLGILERRERFHTTSADCSPRRVTSANGYQTLYQGFLSLGGSGIA